MSLKRRISDALQEAHDGCITDRNVLAEVVLEVMREAPKNVLWAGALHATTDKDLEIWNAMIDEALRE